MKRSSVRRIFLGLFVTSIVANAVLGIWALLSGGFGETQGRVLATSFLVSAAMLSVLVNIPAIRRRSRWPVPAIGAIAGASGFALFIVLLWGEDGDDWWLKLAASLLVVAAAATLAASLALIPAPARFGWLPPVGDALIGVLAITTLVGLWFEPDVEWFGRLIGVEAVLVAAMTLLLPVLSRFSPSRREVMGEAVSADAGLGPPAVRFCPSCGRPVAEQALGTGVPTICDACGLSFEVRSSARQTSDSAPGDHTLAPSVEV